MSTLTLSGWAQPADALLDIAPGADIYDYTEHDNAAAAIATLAKFREHETVIGWSLGGQLALRAVAAGTLRPKKLVLLAVPSRFVGEDGMGAETFRLFRESYAKDPARTKSRFNALISKDDQHAKQVMAALSHHPEAENTARFLPWLDILEEFDAATLDLSAVPLTLIVHGMNDRIVPFAQGEILTETLPNVTAVSLADTGHAPHVSRPAHVRDIIANFTGA